MSAKKFQALFIRFTLLVLTFSICSDPSQSDNNCTSCSSPDFLINQTCYTKIIGCIKHQAGPSCSQCQFGYVLNNSTCIRQGIFMQKTNVSLTFSANNNLISSILQVQKKLGKQNSTYFANCHQYFISKYATQLGNNFVYVKSVDSLLSTVGTYIFIIYEVPNYNNGNPAYFQAVAVLFPRAEDNTDLRIQELYFGQYAGTGKDAVTAQSKILSIFPDPLGKYYRLFQFKQPNNNTFQFDYISDNFINLTRITIKRSDMNSRNAELKQKIILKELSTQEIGIEKIKQLYPQYQDSTVTKIDRAGRISIVHFGTTVSVSFRFYSNRFYINRPLVFPEGEYVATDGLFRGVKKALFVQIPKQQHANLTNFIIALIYQYPEIMGTSLVKASSQQLTTINSTVYLIELKNRNNDVFEIVAWTNSSNIPAVVILKKNGQPIFEDYYNYNADIELLKTYDQDPIFYFLPPISSITMRAARADKKVMKIIFSPLQYAELSCLPGQNLWFVGAHYIDGWNQLATLANPLAYPKPTPQQLLNIIKQSSIPNTKHAQISKVIYNMPQFITNFVTFEGTFTILIQNLGKKNANYIRAFEKIDNITCFQLNISDVRNLGKVQEMEIIFKSAYKGYQTFWVGLVQVQARKYGAVYRVVFVGERLKQIVAYFQNVEGVISIVKVQRFYQSLEVVTNPKDQAYTIANQSIKLAGLPNDKAPFLIESNNTLIKTYYQSGRDTYQLFYNRITKKLVAKKIIHTRNYNLLPDGISVENVIIPGNPPNPIIQIYLDSIFQQALNKFSVAVRNNKITYADRRDNVYGIILSGNNFGYQQFQATLVAGGKIQLGPIRLIQVDVNRLSNCKRFSTQGKCLSCDPKTEAEYEGSCFPKVNGCQYQVGNYCARCSVGYNRISGSECAKDCSLYF